MAMPSAERIEWSRRPDLPGIDILLAENCARRWRVFHETYSVCTGLAIGAPAPWKYRGKIYHQPADGVQLIEPGEVHANTRITDPASFRVLMIDAKLVSRAAQLLGIGTLPHSGLHNYAVGRYTEHFAGCTRPWRVTRRAWSCNRVSPYA